jgi:hypothetical protein
MRQWFPSSYQIEMRWKSLQTANRWLAIATENRKATFIVLRRAYYQTQIGIEKLIDGFKTEMIRTERLFKRQCHKQISRR